MNAPTAVRLRLCLLAFSLTIISTAVAGPVAPTGAVSRKIHGSAGTFDIALPLTGPPGIESRSGGGNNDYTIVVSFSSAVTFSSANVTSGTGSVVSASANGSDITVNLTGVANAQKILITLAAVSDGTTFNDVMVPMIVLAGDTSGDGQVNGADIAMAKAQSGIAVGASNFRSDFTVDGLINGADVAFVKAKSGTGIAVDWARPTTLATGSQAATLALEPDGTLWTWGAMPGDGATSGRSEPFQFGGIANPFSVSAGPNHAAVLAANGVLWMWGHNPEGRIGDATTTDRAMPVPVLSNVVAVAAGGAHTLALLQDGTVRAWGDNYYGELGNETSDDSSTPVAVLALNNVRKVAAGDQRSIALKQDGTVLTWGYNYYDSGTGEDHYQTTPTPVDGLSNVVDIAAGIEHVVALKSDGTVWAWASNNYHDQLGNGAPGPQFQLTPIQVPNLPAIVSVSSRGDHTLAMAADGTVWAWGYNAFGQLGDGTTDVRQFAGQVNGLTGVVAVAAEWSYSMAMKSDGTVWAWGDFALGRLPGTDPHVPQQVILGLVDTNYDGMDDRWEMQFFGTLDVNPDDDPDGDGLTNLQEFQNGSDPTQFYNGTTPDLAIVSGDQQQGTIGSASEALTVRVVDGAGRPLANAPVVFTVTQGLGQVSATNDAQAPRPTAVTVRADAQGNATVYYFAPNWTGPYKVTVDAGDGANLRETTFSGKITQAKYAVIDLGTTFGAARVGNNGVVLLMSGDGISNYRWNQGQLEPFTGHAKDMNNSGVVAGWVDGPNHTQLPATWSPTQAMIGVAPVEEKYINRDAGQGTVLCRIGTVGDDLDRMYYDYTIYTQEEAELNCGTPLDPDGIYGRAELGSKVDASVATGLAYTIDDSGAIYGEAIPANAWATHDLWQGEYAFDYAFTEDGMKGGGSLGNISWSWSDSLFNFAFSGSARFVTKARGQHTFGYRKWNFLVSSNHYAYPQSSSWQVDGADVSFEPQLLNSAGVVWSWGSLYSNGVQRYPELLNLPDDNGYHYSSALNDHYIRKTDGSGDPTSAESPQIVGSFYNYRTGLHSGWIRDEDPDTGNYVQQNLDDLIAQNSGWTIHGATDINDNGVIVGWGDYQATDADGNPTGPLKQGEAVMLVPFEIRDVRNSDDAADDVLVEPMGAKQNQSEDDYWKSATDKNIASIVASRDDGSEETDDPRMPQLEVSFPGAPAGVQVKWKFTCTYDRGNGLRKTLNQSTDNVTIDKTSTPLPADQPWKLHAEPEWEGDFFGGKCELTYQLVGASGTAVSQETTVRFEIGGANPTLDNARSYIDETAVPDINSLLWFSYAIGKQESAYKDDQQKYYVNFYTRFRSKKYQNGQPWRGWWPRFPTFGDDRDNGQPNGSGGYGMFQITQDNVPRKDLWNWQDNAYDAIREVNSWRSEAEEWYRAVVRTWGTPPGNWIPPNPSGEPALSSSKGLGAVDAENVVLYNGPKGLGKGRHVKLVGDDGKLKIFRASVFTHDNTGWHFHDNVNRYVYFVAQHIDPDASQ